MADSPVTLELPVDVIRVVPWVDPVVDALGFDPRSDYVELFWLGVIGPSTTWLMRRLAAGFDRSPEGFTLDLIETARALGIGGHGGLGSRNSPFARTLVRACQFGLAQPNGTQLAVEAPTPPAERAPARAAAHATASAALDVAAAGARDTRRRCSAALGTSRSLSCSSVRAPTQCKPSSVGGASLPSVCHAAAQWAAREHANRTFTPDAA